MEDNKDLLNQDNINNENNANHSTDRELLRKKFLKMFSIIFIIFILFIVILFILSLVFKKTYSYSDIENIMKDAAIKFYNDNEKELPNENGNSVMIKAEDLISSEYMKDFSEYNKNSNSCKGTVTVKKDGDDFIYTPKLNCGKLYTTTSLIEKIIIPEKIVNSGYGLYNINNSYVYRGETVNNYIQLDNSLWRIVKVDANNNIEIIRNGRSSESVSWDDRYNAVLNYKVGINDYSKSRIKDYLTDYYKNNNSKDNDIILSENDKKKLVSFTACINNRNQNDTSKDGSTECSITLDNQKISLLSVYDYMNASVDINCIKTVDSSCQNYNYLSTDFDWWLLNGDPSKSSLTYAVSSGYIYPYSAVSYKRVRPVVYLNSDVLYVSGDGSLEKPFKVR